MKTLQEQKSLMLVGLAVMVFALTSIQTACAQAGTSGGGVIFRELPEHLKPISLQAHKMLLKEAKVNEAIDYLLANPEYVRHPVSSGRYLLSLAYAVNGDWQKAADVLDTGGMYPYTFPVMVLAFSGQIEEARADYETRLSFKGSPYNAYIAQGDSVRALKANCAFYFGNGSTSSSDPWLQRHFLKLAYELAPEAPRIAIVYVSKAEPDIRKGISILNGIVLEPDSVLSDHLKGVKQEFASFLKLAESGKLPFILESRKQRP
jgi:hypothetical protein